MMNEIAHLGRYQVESLIGSGAYADVYRALDTALDRTVALKILKPAVLGDEEAFRRFVREAQVSANLFHPQIATVFDLGEVEGRYFLAMRFVDGLSLDKVILQKGALPWDEALKVTRQIAEALGYAHARGFIHRDVKPQNIILSPAEGAVLTDFGLVKAMEAASTLTRTNVTVGTPQYVPPEIWKGEAPTPQVDQYALACVLVEMLTGKALFDGLTPWAIMQKMNMPPALPEHWPEGVPPGLTQIVGRALAQEPADRFPDMSAFINALDQSDERNEEPLDHKDPLNRIEKEIASQKPLAMTFVSKKESGKDDETVNVHEIPIAPSSVNFPAASSGSQAVSEPTAPASLIISDTVTIDESPANVKEILTPVREPATARKHNNQPLIDIGGKEKKYSTTGKMMYERVITWRGAGIGLAVGLVGGFFIYMGNLSLSLLLISGILAGCFGEYRFKTHSTAKFVIFLLLLLGIGFFVSLPVIFMRAFYPVIFFVDITVSLISGILALLITRRRLKGKNYESK